MQTWMQFCRGGQGFEQPAQAWPTIMSVNSAAMTARSASRIFIDPPFLCPAIGWYRHTEEMTNPRWPAALDQTAAAR